LGLKPEQIKINTLLGGRRAPVRLVGTREDDIKGRFYRPMVLHRVKAGVDPGGRIAGWLHVPVTQSIFAGTPFAQMAIKNGIDQSSVEGVINTPLCDRRFYRSVTQCHLAGAGIVVALCGQ
jgi:CO/xanthine dehydrogenase Mo-binding subunit